MHLTANKVLRERKKTQNKAMPTHLKEKLDSIVRLTLPRFPLVKVNTIMATFCVTVKKIAYYS